MNRPLGLGPNARPALVTPSFVLTSETSFQTPTICPAVSAPICCAQSCGIPANSVPATSVVPANDLFMIPPFRAHVGGTPRARGLAVQLNYRKAQVRRKKRDRRPEGCDSSY